MLRSQRLGVAAVESVPESAASWATGIWSISEFARSLNRAPLDLSGALKAAQIAQTMTKSLEGTRPVFELWGGGGQRRDKSPGTARIRLRLDFAMRSLSVDRRSLPIGFLSAVLAGSTARMESMARSAVHSATLTPAASHQRRASELVELGRVLLALVHGVRLLGAWLTALAVLVTRLLRATSTPDALPRRAVPPRHPSSTGPPPQCRIPRMRVRCCPSTAPTSTGLGAARAA
ncbi:hypothetical protein A8W25_09795 [Streptomyces sp. ERV7]|uniref:hypothetical protein n=1 Tax=Streptomyces sp. ERV7 TaxID=1322334 RepID=UPI0007F41531|nr:hypothetical protein [Streptomyces sp. ERV7]OAR25817.1 hypothetical protein A8W25_09795 [Streptomyces sp. ERV7]